MARDPSDRHGFRNRPDAAEGFSAAIRGLSREEGVSGGEWEVGWLTAFVQHHQEWLPAETIRVLFGVSASTAPTSFYTQPRAVLLLAAHLVDARRRAAELRADLLDLSELDGRAREILETLLEEPPRRIRP